MLNILISHKVEYNLVKRNDLMINIIKKEIEIEETLKNKLEFICSFCNTNCEIQKVQ